MKKLPTKFERKGMTWDLERRVRDLAMYRIETETSQPTWVVVRVQQCDIAGKVRETVPSIRQLGRNLWLFQDRHDASLKIRRLVGEAGKERPANRIANPAIKAATGRLSTSKKAS